jgi:hypothetical protein
VQVLGALRPASSGAGRIPSRGQHTTRRTSWQADPCGSGRWAACCCVACSYVLQPGSQAWRPPAAGTAASASPCAAAPPARPAPPPRRSAQQASQVQANVSQCLTQPLRLRWHSSSRQLLCRVVSSVLAVQQATSTAGRPRRGILASPCMQHPQCPSHKVQPALHKVQPALHKVQPALHKVQPALHKHLHITQH